MRLARSIYESLPYVYMLVGIGALLASFLWRTEDWSDLVAGFGLIVVVTGLALALRRRDFRIQKRRYGAEFGDDD
jgi:small-conductance mechanosensitive channel